jgi:putative ABC transport system permease protein
VTTVRSVPVGRRSLFVERRRALLGVSGVAVTLLMVLLLDGVFAGAMTQITRYIDTSPADVIVAQPGVRNMHMAASTVPLDAVELLRREPGVAWADPILYEASTLAVGDRRELAYLIGYVPGRNGGPVELISGRQPAAGEIVLDDRAAADLGVGIGGEVAAMGRRWTVAGLVSRMGNIVNTLAFVPFDDFAVARQAPGTASFILVGGNPGPDEDSPDGLAGRIEAASGLTALPRGTFSTEERRVVSDMSVEIMQIMTVAALAIGLAVVGLTLYAATLARLREIGVMKALGAGPLRLGRDVAAQAGWTVGLALAAAVPLAVTLGWLVEAVTGNVAIAVEAPSVMRSAISAAFVGGLGAVAPLVKVWRVDPATVFRRAS